MYNIVIYLFIYFKMQLYVVMGFVCVFFFFSGFRQPHSFKKKKEINISTEFVP